MNDADLLASLDAAERAALRPAMNLLVAVWGGAVIVAGKCGPVLEPLCHPATDGLPVAPAAVRLLVKLGWLTTALGATGRWWELSEKGQSVVIATAPFGGVSDTEEAAWRRPQNRG